MRNLSTLTILAQFLLIGPAEAAFELKAARASAPIQVDGRLEEDEWKDAVRIGDFLQFQPRPGEAAREATEAYFFYDDAYLYFGFRCYDSQPSRITAQLNRRDSDLFDDDAVIVVIDTFHDSRSGYFFGTNLLGTQSDGRITDNGRVVQFTWDATWLSAADRFEEGWTAEMAIPLVHLRFQPGDEMTWGLNVGRSCRRILETSFWAGPLEHQFRISQYGTLSGLNLEAAQRKYQLIPYALGKYEDEIGSDYSAGLDFRYAITPENVASVTINPDFAIIEADQEEINLTRFELALPEKRQFFLEDNERYRQRIRTFYSRRIGDIKGGGRILGRRGSWQYAFLTAQSEPTVPTQDETLESGNYSVLRVERDLWKGSTLSFMAGNRYLDNINRGSVGLDASLFFTDTFRFTGQLVRSHGPEEGGRWAFFVRPSRDTATSHVHFRYTHLGDSFGDHVNAIGFIRDDDRREMDSAFRKQFWFREGFLEGIEYNSNYNIYWSQKNVLRSYQIDQRVEAQFRNRWSTEYSFRYEYKLFEKDFYNYGHEIEVGYNTREWQSVSASYEFGRNFDLDFKLLGASFRRKFTDQLAFEYELSRLWLDPDPENDSTIIHVIRAEQNFTKDLFVNVFFQTNSVIDKKNVQVVFVWRYKPPFGTVQFAYQRGTAEFGESSEQGNTFFVKFSYVFG
jgi:hypothetical protein